MSLGAVGTAYRDGFGGVAVIEGRIDNIAFAAGEIRSVWYIRE